MKFGLSKPLVAAAPSKKPSTFSTALYNDPAFSSDPLSHPYFVADSNWALPLAPGHPTLKAQRPLRSFGAHDDTAEAEVEFQLLQPPNSPTSPDGLGEPQSISYPSLVTPSSTPDTTTPCWPPSAPTRTSITSSGVFVKSPLKESTRKRGSLLSWLKEGQPNMRSSSNVAKPSQSHDDVPPPPYEAEPKKPAMVTAPRDRRPALRSRPQTIPASLLNGAAANYRVPVPNGRRLQDLDRIDELDETNPLGIALHHGGPYEAVHAAVQSGLQMPLGISNNGHVHEYHGHAFQSAGDVYMPPEAPIGVPLNLSPGQILPRNFRRQQAKPPRLRSNLVSPLPGGRSETSRSIPHEPVIPPRHRAQLAASGHVTQPLYRNRPPRRAVDNSLDGPAIQIGMAMMQLAASPSAPNDFTFVQAAALEAEPEFDPYDPAHLEPSPTSQAPSITKDARSAVHSNTHLNKEQKESVGAGYPQQTSEKSGCPSSAPVVVNSDRITSPKRFVGDDERNVHQNHLPHDAVLWKVNGAAKQHREGYPHKLPPSTIECQVAEHAATFQETAFSRNLISSSLADIFKFETSGRIAEQNGQVLLFQSNTRDEDEKDPPPYPPPQTKNLGNAAETALQQINGITNKEPNHFKQSGRVIDTQGHHRPFDDIVQHQYNQSEVHPYPSTIENELGHQIGVEVQGLQQYDVPDRFIQDRGPAERNKQHVDRIYTKDGEDDRCPADGAHSIIHRSENYDGNHLQRQHPFTHDHTLQSNPSFQERQPQHLFSGVNNPSQADTGSHIDTTPQGMRQPLGHAHNGQQINLLHRHHLFANAEVCYEPQVELHGGPQRNQLRDPISFEHHGSTRGTSVDSRVDVQYTSLPPMNDGARDQLRHSQETPNQQNFSHGTTPAYLYPRSGAKQLPHFLPKKLVMPTPLQPPNLPPTSSNRYPPSSQFYPPVQSISSRSPSPTGPMPPVLANASQVQHAPPSRKLKKRPSVIVNPVKPPATTISFSPDHIPSATVDKSTFRARTERPTNRVLSKRRTNL